MGSALRAAALPRAKIIDSRRRRLAISHRRAAARRRDAYRVLSGWLDAIQIGIAWGLANAWELTSYSGRGGGHSVIVPGYLRRTHLAGGSRLSGQELVERALGQSGWARMHPRVWNEVFRHRLSVGLGRSDMVAPQTRPESLDCARHFQFRLAS